MGLGIGVVGQMSRWLCGGVGLVGDSRGVVHSLWCKSWVVVGGVRAAGVLGVCLWRKRGVF